MTNSPSTGRHIQKTQSVSLIVDLPRLVERVNALIEQFGMSEDPKSTDLVAREIATHMKSIKEITVHNAEILASQERTNNIRYADLPPLNIEDRLIVSDKLQDIFSRYARTSLEPGSNSGDAQ